VSVFAVFIGFAVCFYFWKPILEFLIQPYREAAIAIKGADAFKNGLGLIYTAPMETVISSLDVALFGGVCLSFPIIAWQLYRFVAPGLYTHEKKAFTPFLIMAPVLFVAGAAMAYYIAMPMVMNFSLRQEISNSVGGVNVTYQGKIADYVHMVTTLVIGFGICFQIPVIQLILGKADLVTSEFWLKNGRYAVLAIITIAAFITPPDVISQLLLSLPLLALYYGGALMVKLIEKKRKEEQPII
jgi:sec-independent protein translocase protein TatC